MHRRLLTLLALLTFCSTASPASALVVRFNTSLGGVFVRLFDSVAPNSVQNFMNYVTSSRYRGTFIHRVPQSGLGGSADFVVQGGGFVLNNSIFDAEGIELDDPIDTEFGLSNVRGTLAFAKNSAGATSQWFFNVGDNSGSLDPLDFTVIGRVLGGGMRIIDEINDLETVNASVAENVPGEDFDEVPVLDLDKVVAQGDITNEDAVIINNIFQSPIPDEDYTFDTEVSGPDLIRWQREFDSTTQVEADGNGDGIVDELDLELWESAFPVTAPATANVPEPSSALIAVVCAGALAAMKRRR